MNCTSCGAPLSPSTAFCPTCGAPTRDPSAATVAIDVAAMEDPLLVKVREALAPYYEVEKELGRGGMAVVYRGKERGLEREVAIKVLPPEMALQGGTAERFRREARLAASLEHQNIIPVYRVGEEQGLIYMAMKFVRGRGLDSIIEQQGALPVNVVLRILTAAAHGLAHAHEHSIVHRDIKGANILIELDGRPLVSDFGIARAMTENSLTASGMVIGTPNFMSPEQCGGQKVGPQSDQYSLGILAFQMLSGQLPFEADSIMGIIQHHYLTPPPDLRQVREGVPDELLAVIYKALGKKPEDRFPTTLEMAEALEAVPQTADEKRESLQALKQLAQGETITKVRTGSLPPLSLTAAIAGAPQAAAATVLTTPGGGPKGKPAVRPVQAGARKRGAPVGLIAAALVVVLGGAGAAYQFVLKPRSAPAPATQANATPPGSPGTTPAAPASATPTDSAKAPPTSTASQPPAPRPQRTAPARTQTPTQQQAPPTAAPTPAPVTATGSLTIRTNPTTANVWVDGVAWAMGGGTRQVPVGTRSVRVAAEGCESKTESVAVESGAPARRVITLTCQGQ
jgi:serine/threonine-protein kinase